MVASFKVVRFEVVSGKVADNRKGVARLDPTQTIQWGRMAKLAIVAPA